MNNSEIRKQGTKGVFWQIIEKYFGQLLVLIIGIIIARILTPRDYGLVGMLTIFIAVGNVIIGAGFGDALIRHKEASDRSFSTVFVFNIAASLALYGILYVVAPYVAAFFNEPELQLITRILSLILVLNSFGRIQIVFIRRQIDFKKQAFINLMSILVSGITGITLAIFDFGYWALVSQHLSKAIVYSLLAWIYSTWKPRIVFDPKEFFVLFKFGFNLLIVKLIDHFFNNVYKLVFGKFYSPEVVGNYSQANKLQNITIQSITGVVQNVTYPLFSKIQDENERLKAYLYKLNRLFSFVSVPLMMLLIVISEPLVRVLLTEKWMDAVPFIQLLSVMGMLYPFFSLNQNLLKIKGRSDLFLKLDIASKSLMSLSIVLLYDKGPLWLITGYVLVGLISVYIFSSYSGKLVGFHFRKQVTDVIPIYLISAGVFLVTYITGRLIQQDIPRLLLQITLGTGLYLLVTYYFMNGLFNELKELLTGFKSMYNKKNNP